MNADSKDSRLGAEEELHLLRTLINGVPDFIFVKDRESRFVLSNRAHREAMRHHTSAGLVGKTDFDILPRDLAAQYYADEQAIIASGDAIVGREEPFVDPSGRWIWLSTTKEPWRDSHGRVVGIIGISRDITDRKRAEDAMFESKNRAEEANRAKSHFLASMSHELRTPLNSVIGFANVLQKNKGGQLDATQLKFVERIQANGTHLLKLLNEILDLSKIEAHKVELHLGPVALDDLVRETIAQQEGLIGDRPVQVIADLPTTMTPITTDRDKVKQVIINLIGNALKFTARGSVTVRVPADPVTRRPLRIDVIDSGIGIPADTLAIIFEAFQQADATTARNFGGTGLGLTISQALCRLMGYQIHVESEVGKGSTFSVHLNSPLA